MLTLKSKILSSLSAQAETEPNEFGGKEFKGSGLTSGMQSAYIHYTEDSKNSKESVPMSIFTQRSTIVQPGAWLKQAGTDDVSGCRKDTNSIESIQAECSSDNECLQKLSTSSGRDDSKVAGKGNTCNVAESSTGSTHYNYRSNADVKMNDPLTEPLVLSSFVCHSDIIPISKLPPSELANFGNISSADPMFAGPSSSFLNEERLSKLTNLLLGGSNNDRFAEVDFTTSVRFDKYSSLICSCGHIGNIFGGENHGHTGYISPPSENVPPNNYQPLTPEMSTDTEIPSNKFSETIEQSIPEVSSAAPCVSDRNVYMDIETGEKCDQVTKMFEDSNKRPKLKLKAYKCPSCKFCCVELQSFSSHLQFHEPQKSFGCSVCDFRSDRNHCVSRHIQLHKWRDIFHKDAVVLTGNALTQHHCAQFKAYILVPNQSEQFNGIGG